jgi:O-6-methylguanine DNA methyltransferase
MSKYAFYDIEFGLLKIGYIDKEIISLNLVKQIDVDNEYSQLSNLAYNQVCEYLKGSRKTFNFPYKLIGTDFQKKVWNTICKIPYGETRTYKQIAEAVNSPKASRAVGMANKKNPIIIAVPCHRVIGKEGKLVGYAGGLEMKNSLLELEKHIDIGGSVNGWH